MMAHEAFTIFGFISIDTIQFAKIDGENATPKRVGASNLSAFHNKFPIEWLESSIRWFECKSINKQVLGANKLAKKSK